MAALRTRSAEERAAAESARRDEAAAQVEEAAIAAELAVTRLETQLAAAVAGALRLLGAEPWVRPRSGKPSPLQAAQLRLALACLLHTRLTREPKAARLHRAANLDIAEMVGLRIVAEAAMFSVAHADVTLQDDEDGGSLATYGQRRTVSRENSWGIPADGSPDDSGGSRRRVALGAAVPALDHGTFAAEFTLLRGNRAILGVVPLEFDAAQAEPPSAAGQGGFGYQCYTGGMRANGEPQWWAGSDGAEEGDRIVLVLSLPEPTPAADDEPRPGQGKLAVIKNGRTLGVMSADLPPRPYRWHAELWEPGDAVRISPIPLAAPSTVPLAGGSRFDRLRQGASAAERHTAALAYLAGRGSMAGAPEQAPV